MTYKNGKRHNKQKQKTKSTKTKKGAKQTTKNTHKCIKAKNT